jgi:hypothetical protein
LDFERFRFVELFRRLEPWPFRAGTFAPFLRASDNPIATACFRLFTLPPRPDFPRRKLPRLRRPIALSTLLLAALLYFRRPDLRLDDFFAAIDASAENSCFITLAKGRAETQMVVCASGSAGRASAYEMRISCGPSSRPAHNLTVHSALTARCGRAELRAPPAGRLHARAAAN